MNDLFYLTDEQRMVRELARKVARERIAPHAAPENIHETSSDPRPRTTTRPRPTPRSP